MVSFAIEVAGEANPLTESLLVHSLKSASSNEPQQIQTGTKQLQQWEKSPRYYVHLQSAFLDRRLPIEVRYLAIIQLKNGIDKYWRKTATNAVAKEDKEAIRSRLLVLDELDSRLALQNALVYAKIARHEFPNDFPSAISSIIDSIRSNAHDPNLRLLRALQILLQLVKELSAARLQKSRYSLQAATPELLQVVGQLYASTLEAGLQHSREETLTIALLAIKVVRRLLISGYEHPNRASEVVDFWNLTIQQLGTLLSRQQPSSIILEKHKLQLGKLHHRLAADHPASFALLPNSVELVLAYWGLVKEFGKSFGSKEAVTSAVASAHIGSNGDAPGLATTAEKLALRGLLTVRACVKMVHNPAQSFKYRQPLDKEEKSTATRIVQNNLLTEPFVKEAMETTITSFFVFRESDLREWEEEPEEWEKREEGDGDDWEFSIRSCAEKLFLDLAINYKDIIVLPLLNVFYRVASPDNEDILLKDSVYTAIGHAAAVLHDQLDFDAFIRNVLVAEVQKQKPGFNILRRRAAILLGSWISVKVSHDSRPLVYQIFQHLLDKHDPSNDLVVRVTAGRQFAKVADEWEFKAEQFMPFADAMLTALMRLIGEVELVETKMALLNTISVIVERLEHQITPYAERIISLLPPLWEQSGEEHLMKQAILTLLARLVNSMKASSQPFHGLVIPIIRGAVEPGSETQVYLLDDALDLWAAILVQTPPPASQQLLDLAQYLFSIYELGSENLRKALEITESYVLLAPDYMLEQNMRTALLRAFATLLGSLRPDANGVVCNLVEVIVRAAQRMSGDTAVNQLAHDMASTGLLGKLLEGLHGAWKAHCTSGPLAERPPVDGIVETDYFAILARLVLGSIDGFCSVVGSAANYPDASGSGTGLEATMKWLLEEWFSHMDNIGDPSRRKLMCLALTKLLETKQAWIMLSLQSLMTIWTDVLTELRDEDTNTADSLVFSGPDALRTEQQGDGPEAPEDVRRREFTFSDPVHSVSLPAFVKHYLAGVIEGSGGYETFEREWLVNVDKDVIAAFGQLGVL